MFRAPATWIVEWWSHRLIRFGKGTFVAQVGSPVKLPGTAIARTPDDLAKAVSGAGK